MKKWGIITGAVIIVISAFVMIYVNIRADNEVSSLTDILVYQESLEKRYTSYGYKLDDPKVVLNPYDISPLTALIIFETSDEAEATVTVKGKDELSTYNHTFNKSKVHYLSIYGLYPDYDNEIEIKIGNDSKVVNIKTDKLPDSFNIPVINNRNLESDLYFFSTDNCEYGVDVNGDVRWYLKMSSKGKIDRLENGHLLLGTDREIKNNIMTGLFEIDLLGKVYREYVLEDGYGSDYIELPNNNLLVTSGNKFTIMEKLSGIVIKKIELDKIVPIKNIDIKNVWYDKISDTLLVNLGDMVIAIDYKTFGINYIFGNYRDELKEYNDKFLRNTNNIKLGYINYIYILDNNLIIYMDNNLITYKISMKNMTYEEVNRNNYDGSYMKYIGNNDYLIYNDNVSKEIKNDEEVINISNEDRIYYFNKMKLYSMDNYKIGTGTRLGNNSETKTTGNDFVTFMYRNIDDSYLNYEVELVKVYDRFVVSGKFNIDDKVKVILYRFMNKKTYKLDTNIGTLYINNQGLTGSYTIMIEINNKLYKTNEYVSF